jgi:PAS domain S-box-containing protein
MSDPAGASLPAAFDDLDVGVVLHDPETGAIVDANERAGALYGYPVERLGSVGVGGLSAASTQFTEGAAVERIKDAAAGSSQQFEWQIRRKTGEIRWIRVHLNATTFAGSSYVLAEVHDITEQRDRERRLRLLSRIVRHNLRNTATGIIGYAELIEQAVENDSVEEEIDTLISMAEEIGELSDSVTQVEEVVALDASDRSPLELAAFLPPLVEDVRSEFEVGSVSVDVPPDVWVMGNRGLEYAVVHTLENALEHNGSDEPLLELTVEETPTEAAIRIADDGPLIPEHETRVLNETVETSSTAHGTGVGLWVMQWAVNSLGGELAFEENDYGGNTVSIWLPKVESVNS